MYGLSWRRQWQSTSVLLPGKSHGWRSLVGCSPWGPEELDMTEWLHFHFSLSCIGEGNGNPLQYSCLENPRDGRAWWVEAAVCGVAQSQERLKRLSSSSLGFPGGSMVKNLPAVQETWNWSLGQEDPLEKRMVNHSSILAWKIPWREEPSGPQSMDSRDWVTNTFTLMSMYINRWWMDRQIGRYSYLLGRLRTSHPWSGVPGMST